ncbi:Serpentine Receptor, class XA [Caenorhabditis elegans]|uniref:Serpentine Receptor, class XA n=1 Tax=Caenorhabditis elegans TaxID=6239 RepID=Q94413_CAEEL|nr:Serpentine Receptor, class XA [Caenorhabditis elegans]CAB01906.3 Serpentine Receptor, class XA [Caenorhabditis elegans]|eukprot:NP_510592.2 Serpentine Receptor, class XA [Caenorhabditis elegans]
MIFFFFNMIFMIAAISNMKDTSLPLAYICLMCISGMLSSFLMAIHAMQFLIYSQEDYERLAFKFGTWTTLMGTFSYLNTLFIRLTINRVFIVIKPFNSFWFSQPRIFTYCGFISLMVFASLLIPLFSSCFIYFRLDILTFVSGCAPNRHPITVFQNKYSIILPLSCMFVNIGIILHLRFKREGTYEMIKKVFSKHKTITPFAVPLQNTTLSKLQARRDLIMMRQTVSVAVYLSIYELGALLIRVFPTFYAGLPDLVHKSYFYIRYESIPPMTFFVYYLETGSTRRMLKRFLKFDGSNFASAANQTVVPVGAKQQTRAVINPHS